MADGSQEFNAILKQMFFSHLEQLIQFGPSSAFGRSDNISSTLSELEKQGRPPITNLTLGNAEQMRGAAATRRSIPLR
jgi:hypothetical protein